MCRAKEASKPVDSSGLLTALAPDLTARLRTEPALRQRAMELARAWVGHGLAARVQAQAEGEDVEPTLDDLPVMLVAYAADNPRT